jgi:hypothetical protein
MKKLIFLLIPIISFAQEDSLKNTSALDYLYPKKDLVFQYQDEWEKVITRSSLKNSKSSLWIFEILFFWVTASLQGEKIGVKD